MKERKGILCTGWAVKLSFSNKTFPNWKVRKFVLTKYAFNYSDDQFFVKGTYDRRHLGNAEAISPQEVPNWESCLFTLDFPFPVRLWIKEQPFYFAVSTQQEQIEWIIALNNQPLSRPNESPEPGIF